MRIRGSGSVPECHRSATLPLICVFFFTGCIHGPEQGGRERRGGADLAGLQRGGGRKLSGTHEVFIFSQCSLLWIRISFNADPDPAF